MLNGTTPVAASKEGLTTVLVGFSFAALRTSCRSVWKSGDAGIDRAASLKMRLFSIVSHYNYRYTVEDFLCRLGRIKTRCSTGRHCWHVSVTSRGRSRLSWEMLGGRHRDV